MMASFDPKTSLLVMALPLESGEAFKNAGVEPLYTGMGQVKAASSLTKAIMEHRPTAVLNLGTAGSFHLPQGQCFECSGFTQRPVNNLGPRSSKISTSTFISSLPRALCGSADFIQDKIFDKMTDDFDLMDMEAYALAYVAQQFDIPFHCIKFVSDHSNENLLLDWKKNLALAQENLFAVYQQIIVKKPKNYDPLS